MTFSLMESDMDSYPSIREWVNDNLNSTIWWVAKKSGNNYYVYGATEEDCAIFVLMFPVFNVSLLKYSENSQSWVTK